MYLQRCLVIEGGGQRILQKPLWGPMGGLLFKTNILWSYFLLVLCFFLFFFCLLISDLHAVQVTPFRCTFYEF